MIITPIVQGYLIKRYKRFLADVYLPHNQETITAHCPNSGAMLGLLTENNPVVLTDSSNPARKLKYTLQAIQSDDTWVGINTMIPNELVYNALTNQNILPLTGYTDLKREVKYGTNSRIDFLLKNTKKPDCYVEVKNVTLKRQLKAEFPDCVTARGKKHLEELTILAQKGYRCVIIYLIQRHDCCEFSLAEDLDPAYAKAAMKAKEAGVETLVLTYRLLIEESSLHYQLL